MHRTRVRLTSLNPWVPTFWLRARRATTIFLIRSIGLNGVVVFIVGRLPNHLTFRLLRFIKWKPGRPPRRVSAVTFVNVTIKIKGSGLIVFKTIRIIPTKCEPTAKHSTWTGQSEPSLWLEQISLKIEGWRLLAIDCEMLTVRTSIVLSKVNTQVEWEFKVAAR